MFGKTGKIGKTIWPILLQGVPGIPTQNIVAIGSAVFAVPGNGRTDRRMDGQTDGRSDI